MVSAFFGYKNKIVVFIINYPVWIKMMSNIQSVHCVLENRNHCGQPPTSKKSNFKNQPGDLKRLVKGRKKSVGGYDKNINLLHHTAKTESRRQQQQQQKKSGTMPGKWRRRRRRRAYYPIV